MTVSELIEHLQKLPPASQVIVRDAEFGYARNAIGIVKRYSTDQNQSISYEIISDQLFP